MRVEFDVYGGQCCTPCPRGKEPMVNSQSCQRCPHYGRYLGEMAIECLAQPKVTPTNDRETTDTQPTKQ